MDTTSSPEWGPNTKRTIAVLFFLAFVVLAWFLRQSMPLVIVACLIAFALNPVASFLTTHVFRAPNSSGSRRGLAILVTFALMIFFIFVMILVVVPPIIQQFQEFGSRLPDWLRDLELQLTETLNQPIMFNDEPLLFEGEPFVPLDRLEEATGTRDLTELLNLDALTLESLQDGLNTFLNSARSLSEPAFSFVGGALSTLVNGVFLFVMTFYLLKDGRNFVNHAIGIVPETYQDDTRRLLADLNKVWSSYVRGQLILSFTMGSATYVAASLLGLPNPAALGLIAGVFEFIPTLGPMITLISAAFLALVSVSTTIPPLGGVPFMVVAIVVWAGLQNLEAYILVPRIMGENLDLHPFVILVAFIGGAAIGGALGVILAAPFVASGRVIVHYIYGKLVGRNPFREEADVIKKEPAGLARLLRNLYRLGIRGLRILRDRLRSSRQASAT